MKNIILQTETTSNILEELKPIIESFCRLLSLNLSETTVKHERHSLQRFFTYIHLSKNHYKKVTQSDIEAYVIAQKCSQHTRAHTIYTIKRFYKYLKEENIVENNPAENIKIVYPKKKNLIQSPTLAEIKNVFRKLEKDKTYQSLHLRLMVELAYGSGLRVAEISTMNMEDINLTNKTAHVLGKGRKERIVPLTNRCMDVLKKYFLTIKEPRKPLFAKIKGPHRGRRPSPPTISQAIRKKTKYNAHLFRHACATHMLLNGCNIRYIQELLGHERTNTTQIYTKLRNEELRQVINKKHPCAKRITLLTYPQLMELDHSD